MPPVLADAAAAALLAKVAPSRVLAEARTAVRALAGSRPTMRAFGHVSRRANETYSPITKNKTCALA